MDEDFDRRRRATASRDARFDGWFVAAMPRTRVYCRPSCPARPAPPHDVCFFPTAAAAQCAGFRACTNCPPDASPGSPQWAVRDDVVARAMRLIADGVLDREGIAGLAARAGSTARELQRLLQAEAGAPPLALARAQHAQTARLLIEFTQLPFDDVARAAGFSTARRFDDTVRAVYDAPPAQLRQDGRARTAARGGAAPGTVSLRLATRTPFAYEGAFGHLAAGAVPGCEEVRAGAFRRTLRLPGGNGIVGLTPAVDHVGCRLALDDLRDLSPAIARCRRLLDLDADPQAVIEALAADTRLEPIVGRVPGQRIPRAVDESELAVRAVLGQQVSTKAARTHTHRLVVAHGQTVDDPDGGLTHVFPSMERLAQMDPATLALPRARQQTLVGLIGSLADGSIVLGPGSDWARARRQLLALPGIGAWTAELVAMRGLGDPDAFPATDLGVRTAAAHLGIPAQPKALIEYSARWRPWRAYATQHLWTTLDHAVNDWPPKEAA